MKDQNSSANRPKGRLLPNPKARLREQVHEVARFKHLSLRTEETYWGWIVRYLRFHRRKAQPAAGDAGPTQGWVWRHPREMGAAEVREFLVHLAVERHVAEATQNQALHPVR